MHVQLYPTLPSARLRALARDLLIIALLVLSVILGGVVHGTIEGLNVLSSGVQQAGSSIDDSFRSAGDSVHSVPLVGGKLRSALDDTGASSGGRVVTAGTAARHKVDHIANLMGWLTGGLAALWVLVRLGWPRVRQVRQLTVAATVLRTSLEDESHRMAAAQRAAFGLPYARLVGFTRDPLGDLVTGRYGALIAALFADAGMQLPEPVVILDA